jgi:hypothetical protein
MRLEPSSEHGDGNASPDATIQNALVARGLIGGPPHFEVIGMDSTASLSSSLHSLYRL